MTTLADAKTKEVDTGIREALETALARGALPGEREGFDEAALAAAALFVGRTANGRQAGQPAIAIETLGEGANGRFMRIALINDDMPFLVDSIANALAAADITIHRLLHPVLSITRNSEGALAAILDDDAPGARRESMIYIEMERIDAKGRKALIAELERNLRQVRFAVQDWQALQAAMQEDAGRVEDREGAKLLRWFLDRNLTQLAHENWYDDGKVTGQLGIAREKMEPGLLAESSRLGALDWFKKGGRVPLLLKSNAICTVHRRVPYDLILVPIRTGDEVVGLSIHAGIWTSSALHSSPRDVPVLRYSPIEDSALRFDPV